MEFKAEQKYILISPRKARPIVDIIRRMAPMASLDALALVDKKAAQPILKTIKQALANARVKGVESSELTFKEIFISEGPRLRRGNPVSRGMWHPIKKRMSHIRVILQTKEVTKIEDKDTKEVEPAKSQKGGKEIPVSSSEKK